VAAETRSVVVRLSMEASQYIREAQKAGRVGADAMTQVEKSTGKAGHSLDDLGSKAGRMAVGATAALLAVGKAAVDWESQFAGVEKTVDGTTSQMAELEEGLRGLAKTLPATHEEIAGVAEAAGQLGVAREDVVDFTKTMVDLGETTNLTAQDAATNIAQIANVMGTTGDEVDNLGSALVALGNDGASTEKQILDMTQRIAGAGAQIGLAESDILAIANAAASMGIEAEAGGSSISRVFTELAKATKQGGAGLEQFSKVAGVSAAQFVKDFEEDPARAFAAFTKGLDQINQSGGDVFTVLDQLGLADVRVSQALLGMAASGDLLTDSLDLGAQAWEDNTALAIEAAKRYATTAAQMQVSWNQIKDAAIDAGQSLLPILQQGAKLVGGLADAFGALPAPVQSSFTGLAGIGALVGGGLWITAKTIGTVNDLRESLSGLAIESPRVASGLGKVGKAAGIAGIALAGLSIADSLQRQADDSLPSLEKLTRGLLDLAGAAEVEDAKKIAGDFDTIGESLDRLADPNAAQKLQDAIYAWDKTDLLGSDSRFDDAANDIDGLDSALANLVSTGNADKAAAALKNVIAAEGIEGGNLNWLLDNLPEYDDALLGVANSEELVAGSTLANAGAQGELGSALELSIEAMRDLRQETLRSFDANTNYRAAILDAKDALKENGNTLDINTRAGQANRDKLSALAGAWNDLSVQAQNVPGAYKGALDTFVAIYGHLFKNEEAARRYAKRLYEIPERVATEASLDASSARAILRSYKAELDALQGRTIKTYVKQLILREQPGNPTNTDLYGVPEALGGFHPRHYAEGGLNQEVRAYAAGGIDRANGHQPEFATRPGAVPRVWLEEETGGETYIPTTRRTETSR
jgi:TP901 family phage tail tape measure protein